MDWTRTQQCIMANDIMIVFRMTTVGKCDTAGRRMGERGMVRWVINQ
jgi:hypothetical protein